MSLKNLMAAASFLVLAAACSQQPDQAETAPEPVLDVAPAVEAQAEAPETIEQPALIVRGIEFAETADGFKQECDAVLQDAQAQLDALEAFQGDATVDTFYRPLNDLLMAFVGGYAKAALFENVHPNEDIRTANEECVQKFDRFSTELNLSRPVFDALNKIDTAASDAATQFSVEKALRDYRRSGVDKDEETRNKIRKLNEEITIIGQDFGRNIREDVRVLELASADQLKGLPQDYIDSHKPDENGIIRITTDYPDYIPFVTYAEDDELRKQMRILSRSRGYPQNAEVLKNLLTKRHELAQVLGYETYAHYITDDKMVGSPERAQEFIDEIAGTVKEAASRDKALLLERLKQIDPGAEEVGVWQYSYLKELLATERYNVDSKELRQYFQFGRVRQGIFDLTSDLFGIEIKEWDAPVWHEDVSAYQVWQDGELLGLFYLDLHPREGKYKHAAHFGTQDGILGKQLPISVLVCNFPGKGDDSALMEHDDVVTFLHEFGHLLHSQFAGRVEWMNNSGIATERDFVEAPSQLLEEWAFDYDTLRTFAVSQEGKEIPAELVERLNTARFFGQGINTATQTFYASLSLAYYNRDPETFELLPLMQELEAEYGPFPYLDDTHFYANFGHLDGYSAIYYTYQWSLAISTDMFSKFADGKMRDVELSRAYREAVLDPGGSRPADELVEAFLGRPFSTDAYKAWLTRTE